MNNPTRVYIKDDLMKHIHTKQILNELRERVPKTHFNIQSEQTGIFAILKIHVPRKIWLASYPSTEEVNLWFKSPAELQKYAEKANK